MKKTWISLLLSVSMGVAAQQGTPAGVEAVDLGLSVKWASCNVGAQIPEQYGDFYSWGEVQKKKNYDWTLYQHRQDLNGDGKMERTEFADLGMDIGGTSLDVAHVAWGGAWRMPTKAEIQELIDKCTWVRTERGRTQGYDVIAPNGNYIFLPLAGFSGDKKTRWAGKSGYYWSSTGYKEWNYEAVGMAIDGGEAYLLENFRNYGYSVRPVSAQ